MHEADDAIARFDTVHISTDRHDIAGDVASQLHRHGEGPTAMDSTLVSGGLAVELMNLAGAVLDIPARYRCGDHFHQNIVGADGGLGIVAVIELVRPTEFKQADGFHRVRSRP